MVAVLVVTSASIAHADDAPAATPTAITFAEVVAAAARSPAAQVVRHEIDAADALVGAASAWPDPSLRVETNRLTARLVAGVTVPLPLFGTVGALRREAAAEAQAVRAAAIVDQRATRRRAITAWIALARADGEVAATTIAATQAAEIERIARGRLDAGSGANVDVTAARAARARADLAVSTARRAEQAASAELAGALGLDPDRPLVASGELPGAEEPTIEQLRTRLPAHPERTVAQRRLLAAEATIAQVRAQRYPGLALESQVSMFDPETAGTDVLVAVSLDVPVFAHTGDRVRSARATAAAAKARLAITETQLGAGLVAAYRRWQSAHERLIALETQIVPAQVEAATLSAQAYREGARDLASALLADRDLTDVRAEVVTARADLATAWADLQEASGE